MPSSSTRLSLKRPLTTDAFSTQDIYDNWTTLDGFPGLFICTSSTRPSTWGASHAGMQIWETDTNLMWRWSGTGFVRSRATGLLGSSTLTSDFTTTATSMTSVTPTASALTCTVTVPTTTTGSTAKRIKVTASFFRLDNTLGAAQVALYRDGGSPTLLTLSGWRGKPSSDADPMNWASGGTVVGYDAPPVAGASTTYSLRVCCVSTVGGTAGLRAAATSPATLVVEEVGL